MPPHVLSTGSPTPNEYGLAQRPLSTGSPNLQSGQIADLKALYINEPGVYDLIFGSQKEQARAFKRWVTHDVLPHLGSAEQAQRRAGTVPSGHRSAKQALATVKVGSPNWLAQYGFAQRVRACPTAS